MQLRERSKVSFEPSQCMFLCFYPLNSAPSGSRSLRIPLSASVALFSPATAEKEKDDKEEKKKAEAKIVKEKEEEAAEAAKAKAMAKAEKAKAKAKVEKENAKAEKKKAAEEAKKDAEDAKKEKEDAKEEKKARAAAKLASAKAGMVAEKKEAKAGGAASALQVGSESKEGLAHKAVAEATSALRQAHEMYAKEVTSQMAATSDNEWSTHITSFLEGAQPMIR